MRVVCWGVVLAALAGCAAPKSALKGVSPLTQGRVAHGPLGPDAHVPPFALVPWEKFSRADAMAIALREWRLFGSRIDDTAPATHPVPAPQDKAERQAGLWQRVGEYWWIGQDPGEREANWTGKHDENGQIFDAAADGDFAWSAAFISYIMRIAGAGPDFPYSPNHATYINAAARGTTKLLTAFAPNAYAPQPGDLICLGRGAAAQLKFSDLPAPDFPAHCDIVVSVAQGDLTVIGGNVDDAVTAKHVPISDRGLLVGADGTNLDPRFVWLVVLRVNYAG